MNAVQDPALRLATIEAAGQAQVPFTSGILIGIGETRAERVDSLSALHDLHLRYGHIQVMSLSAREQRFCLSCWHAVGSCRILVLHASLPAGAACCSVCIQLSIADQHLALAPEHSRWVQSVCTATWA